MRFGIFDVKKILEDAAETFEDMADVAELRGMAYLYRKDTGRIRKISEELRNIAKAIADCHIQENI